MNVDVNQLMYEKEMQRIKKDFVKSIIDYKQNIDQMLFDVPIQVLCLPENINKILARNKILRVSELRCADLSKIKGLGIKKIGIIQFRLGQFVLM